MVSDTTDSWCLYCDVTYLEYNTLVEGRVDCWDSTELDFSLSGVCDLGDFFLLCRSDKMS